jgi:aldehyde dehydrogenase (NAD+)
MFFVAWSFVVHVNCQVFCIANFLFLFMVLQVPVPPMALPGTAFVVPEPLGVALVIAPWNFPLSLGVDPLIGAISAGCAAVLKPSEITPTVSSILADLLPKYLDTDAIRVVEGGIPITTALLAQKWDKIFFTGILLLLH